MKISTLFRACGVLHHTRCAKTFPTELYYCATVPNGHLMTPVQLSVHVQTGLIGAAKKSSNETEVR
jgi:hypothetical protein